MILFLKNVHYSLQRHIAPVKERLLGVIARVRQLQPGFPACIYRFNNRPVTVDVLANLGALRRLD